MFDMPLGGKGYGHICHLPGSRITSGDRVCGPREARICTQRVRDGLDRVVVTEKLDGANVCVARLDGELVAVSRAGNRCDRAPQEEHRVFAYWAGLAEQRVRFDAVLRDGERLVGEWLALVHQVDYALPHEPFVAFDLMRDQERLPWDELRERLAGAFTRPAVVHDAAAPFAVEGASAILAQSRHGARGPAEGAVWRVERDGRFDFMAKWVGPVHGAAHHQGDLPAWRWHPWRPTAATPGSPSP